jgi:predicted transcriptional regulator
MEVHLDPDLPAKLIRIAAEQGRDTEAVAREAIERLVDLVEFANTHHLTPTTHS